MPLPHVALVFVAVLCPCIHEGYDGDIMGIWWGYNAQCRWLKAVSRIQTLLITYTRTQNKNAEAFVQSCYTVGQFFPLMIFCTPRSFWRLWVWVKLDATKHGTCIKQSSATAVLVLYRTHLIHLILLLNGFPVYPSLNSWLLINWVGATLIYCCLFH